MKRHSPEDRKNRKMRIPQTSHDSLRSPLLLNPLRLSPLRSSRRTERAQTAGALLLLAGLSLAGEGCAASGQQSPSDGGNTNEGASSFDAGDGGSQTNPEGGSAPGTDGGDSGATTHDSGGASGDATSPTESGPTAESGAPPDGGGATESGTGTGGCASLPLCDNFDEDTAGVAPPSSTWTLVLGCNASQATDGPAMTGGGLMIQVDSSQHHSGANSVRVAGGDSCGYYFVNAAAIASLGTQVYARFWVMLSGAPTMNHNGFLSMYSGPAVSSTIAAYNNTPQLRLGTQGGVVVWNSTINGADSTLPDIDSTGEAQSVAPQAMTWSCIEFHLDQTTANIEFRFEGQGATMESSVMGLSYDGTGTMGVSDTWKSSGPTSLALKTFGLGWLDINNQYTAWFDDVALSGTNWIGCD
jgi:hypothetical protein